MFIDEATITVRSGDGGRGSVSFRREKYMPRGGPDGGDGGAGGDVFLEASPHLNTLMDLSRRRYYAAENGRAGAGNNRTGRSGADAIVQVPVGTIVREVLDEDTAMTEAPLLGDLVKAGQRLLVAAGGKGGRGNKSFATSTHQVPRIAQEGIEGTERRLYLELKLLADLGLVGLPNAGKSTLLSRISAATPKIAGYPFTTLSPVLGVVEQSDYRRLVVADIPGLIEGAHTGQGLGTDFLRHIERTRVLVHLVSVESMDVDTLLEHYRTVEQELSLHSSGLRDKPRLVVVSKVDLILPEEREAICKELGERLEARVLSLSGVSGLGVNEVLNAAAELLPLADKE